MPKVSINKSQIYEVNDGDVIFEALDDQGEELPHGCLAGSCGACRIEVLSGAENLSPVSELEQNTIDAIAVNYKRIHGEEFIKDKIIRLSCRAKVYGDVDINPLD